MAFPPTPTTLLLADPAQLPLARSRLHAGEFPAAWDALRAAALLALDTPPLSVVQKSALPPSGDPHDYVSLGTYWWPDPTSPDGLPYIRRDGERNPACDQYDSPRLKRLAAACRALAWAYYFGGEDRFAEKAAALLRTWFLDPATRMNPHLEFAQFIPGVCLGRGIGIIDTSTVLLDLLDAAALVSAGGALSSKEQDFLCAWMESFRDWNYESVNGQDEARQHNNHGTYYDMQQAGLEIFTGRPQAAAQILRDAREKRIASQVMPDGSQPHELARTRSLGYTTMNLRGFVNLACLGKKVGVDLWRWQTSDGRGIRAALDWLCPYVSGEQAWQGAQITAFDPAEFVPIYRRAALAYAEPRYEQALRGVPQEVRESHLAQLLYPVDLNEE